MSNEVDLIERLYRLQCDGLWEHSKGFRIQTTDNPGWLAELDCKEPVEIDEDIAKFIRERFGASASFHFEKLSVFASSLRELFMALAAILIECCAMPAETDFVSGESNELLMVGDRVRIKTNCSQSDLRGQYGFVANPPEQMRKQGVWDGHVKWEIENELQFPRYWIVLDSINRAAGNENKGDHVEAELAAEELQAIWRN